MSDSSANTPATLQVALPVPLRRQFDYLLPPDSDSRAWQPGQRVRVPFGKQTKVGIIVGRDHPSSPIDKLKAAETLLDPKPLLDTRLHQLLLWAARYYQHPLGDALLSALPVKLRDGEPAERQKIRSWELSEAGAQQDLDHLKKARRQQQLLALLKRDGPQTDPQLRAQEISAATVRAVEDKGLIRAAWRQPGIDPHQEMVALRAEAAQRPTLNAQQAIAVAAISEALGRYQTFLLEGVTGSGKTEVYLSAMEPYLEAGLQVLVLVPEIGLTPQTIARFEKRFSLPLAVLHSGLNDSERLAAWLDARDGRARIVIGTRSALFTPLQDLGLIIVDEEHDLSLKQQDGFRYHARDLAAARAHKYQVPLVLGTATPSLESLQNALAGRYRHLHLPNRAGKAETVKADLIDIKHRPLQNGLSPELVQLIGKHLADGNQVMLFINRRGYAPALMCHECGWLGECRRCDAYLTFHQQIRRLQCHHCGAQQPVQRQCPDCGSTKLVGQGVGTEQLEQALQQLFPDASTVRIDRDSTRRKGQMQRYLDGIKRGEYNLLIGTQMLAKGHHFPDVTLVAILDVDGALFSADFRAAERLGQLIVQVAGRAGRASKPGRMVLQTHHPEHPLLQDLLQNGYAHFARSALTERQQALLPPFRYMALFRCESLQAALAEQFLSEVRHLGEAQLQAGSNQLAMLGPIPAPMERRAGKFRFQLLVEAHQRQDLHRWLTALLAKIEALPSGRKVRWSLDIDPQDMC